MRRQRAALRAFLLIPVVGVLASAVVIAGPVGNAAAFQPAPPVAPSTAVKTAVAVGRWVGPVGVAVGTAYSAWWLYQNQDRIASWWDSLWTEDAVIKGRSLNRGFTTNPGSDPLTGAAQIKFKCFLSATSCGVEHSPSSTGLDGFAKCRNPSNNVTSSWTYKSSPSIPSIQAAGSEVVFQADSLCGTNGMQLVGLRIVGRPCTTSGCQTPISDFVYAQWCPDCPEQSKKRSVQGRVTCKKSDGTEVTVLGPKTTFSQPQQQNGASLPTFTIPSCELAHPGSTTIKEEALEANEGDSVQEPQASKWSRYIDSPWLDPTHPNYVCMTGTRCKLSVEINGVACDVGVAGCYEWWTDRTDPKYACRWGPSTIGINGCEPLRDQYKPETETTTDPDTGVKTKVTTTTTTSPSSDPTTGTNPEPTSSPSPSVDPSTGATTYPQPDPTTIPKPDAKTVDPDSKSCLGAAWTWNPVSWVYVPVKCAFIWAFVPKTDLQLQLAELRQAWESKAPFSLVTYAPTFAGFLDGPYVSSSVCPSWRVKVGPVDKEILCNTPFGDAIVASRPIFTAFFLAMALMPLLRSVWYAAFPMLKPVPH